MISSEYVVLISPELTNQAVSLYLVWLVILLDHGDKKEVSSNSSCGSATNYLTISNT